VWRCVCLAKAAGVTKAAFYHHVGRKEELLERGLTEALDALFAVLEEPGAKSDLSITSIQYILRRIVELEHELLPQVTVLLRARGNSKAERSALARRRTFDKRFAELIQQAQRDGFVRGDLDAQLIAKLAIGMATWIIEWYSPGGSLSPTQVADAVVEMACNGMAAPPPARRPTPPTTTSSTSNPKASARRSSEPAGTPKTTTARKARA
jgi:AcrR family transcriptional regulator